MANPGRQLMEPTIGMRLLLLALRDHTYGVRGEDEDPVQSPSKPAQKLVIVPLGNRRDRRPRGVEREDRSRRAVVTEEVGFAAILELIQRPPIEAKILVPDAVSACGPVLLDDQPVHIFSPSTLQAQLEPFVQSVDPRPSPCRAERPIREVVPEVMIPLSASRMSKTAVFPVPFGPSRSCMAPVRYSKFAEALVIIDVNPADHGRLLRLANCLEKST